MGNTLPKIQNALTEHGSGNHPLSPVTTGKEAMGIYLHNVLKYGTPDTIRHLSELAAQLDPEKSYPDGLALLLNNRSELNLHVVKLNEEPHRYYRWRINRYREENNPGSRIESR